MWLFRGSSPTLHMFIIIGDQVPEADLGTLDGQDRYPYAGAKSGVPETAGYAQGGIFGGGTSTD